MKKQTAPADEVAETATDTNPHSDLPNVPDISTDTPATEVTPEERPLPFGVYRGVTDIVK